MFPDLHELWFELWPPWCGGDEMISEDIKMAREALVNDWELACRNLDLVGFLDGSVLETGPSSDWFLRK